MAQNNACLYITTCICIHIHRHISKNIPSSISVSAQNPSQLLTHFTHPTGHPVGAWELRTIQRVRNGTAQRFRMPCATTTGGDDTLFRVKTRPKEIKASGGFLVIFEGPMYDIPIGLMYGIFVYIAWMFMVNAGRYTSPMDPSWEWMSSVWHHFKTNGGA